MPLEHYKRGRFYWVRGRVEFNGTPITDYYRESTGSLTEAGADDWIAAETNYQRRCHLVGPEAALTFAEAVVLYPANPEAAKQLIPITARLGSMPLSSITEDILKDLGKELKPEASTETWWREIVTPARAVINKAHRRNPKVPGISVSRYAGEELNAQDNKRGKLSKIRRIPANKEWIERFCAAADPHNAALVRFMFETAARIDQSTSITHDHLDPKSYRVWLKAQKGHVATWVVVTPEMMGEILSLPHKRTRSPKTGKLLEQRVFGYASSTSYNERWKRICSKADIPYLSAHAAGRHGFFTELTVRQGINPIDAAKAGRWADPSLPMRIYAHAEAEEADLRALFRTKPVQPKTKKPRKSPKKKGKKDDK
ncbi:tyrosine-type recombinase/integrase [Sulfitobacter geojensis]|uniref:tyrosine-type recombinase/integrase n=1 Tax=Sulfitobacter geojensis TaxID=1342299 RepID=UPI002492C60D|nr:tyrosine-type recombinase/integrase [Sulfitobacter geojensis]